MRETTVQAPPYNVPREERGLTRLAFTRLLEWLDNGVDSQGETYLEMRRRLVFYFDRRNLLADELADETFNRIGRTLEKDGAIAVTPPARYCYVIARFVLLEDVRRDYTQVRLDETRSIDVPAGHGATLFELDGGHAIRERLDCLDCCLAKLKAEQRELVIAYYGDAGRQKIERRRDLAMRLGITLNALGIRACRIRRVLEQCLQTCGKA